MVAAKDLARAVVAAPWRGLASIGIRRVANRPVSFIVERQNWSIRWDGIQICERINLRSPGVAGICASPERVTGAVAHFGSQFLWQVWHPYQSTSNKVVISYFHGKPEDGPEMARHVDCFLKHLDRIDRVIVANRSVHERLLSWGVPAQQLALIPIGVDTTRFRLPTDAERMEARRRFGVPDGMVAIGSFQKDGVGWGDGMEPKLIKGPDLFVETVERLNRDFPVFVVLTGPARGYVKQGLDSRGIPYSHHYLENYFDVPHAYHALDLYLMTSREEGGPKSLLECAASGVPVVSSRVGMAPDVIDDGVTGCLTDVGDIDATHAAAASLLSDVAKRVQLKAVARDRVAAYDWSVVGDAHFSEVYEPLLRDMGLRA